MADERGFLKYKRQRPATRPVDERLRDFHWVHRGPSSDELNQQAARCMDCGVPFCQNGCPLGNKIPEWNDLSYRSQWEAALTRLHSTNNFPEFTGLVCPAPCESSCVLGINDDPVTIKQIEYSIVDHGWKHDLIQPMPATRKSGKSVAVVGSGPAGLSAAQQLARAGHEVEVFEKQDRIGGLLRYGIPDFKLEKHVIDRRLAQLEAEGVVFHTGAELGNHMTLATLRENFDAVLLCMGSEIPRQLDINGRESSGIHFAMDFLRQQNRLVSGDTLTEPRISAEDKHVVVIGGGDTGSDCVGTSLRQGAKSVTSLELLPEPPSQRHPSEPWPLPKRYFYRTSTSHEEGGERRFAVETKEFLREGGRVTGLVVEEVEFDYDDKSRPLLGTRRAIRSHALDADLVLLAVGFVGVNFEKLADGAPHTDRGRVVADTNTFATDLEGVFAAGDCRRGQSLVVWAQWEGREAARAIDTYLMGHSELVSRDTVY